MERMGHASSGRLLSYVMAGGISTSFLSKKSLVVLAWKCLIKNFPRLSDSQIF